MTNGNKTILIFGGGIGGIVAATRLRQRLAHNHRVILVEKEADHVFAPSLLWLMLGQRRPAQISRPIAALAKRGIEVVQGSIERIDPVTRTVHVNSADISGDHMIVALGAELTPQLIPGLVQAGHDFYTLSGAQSLCSALPKFRTGRLIVLVAAMPFKCPAAPNEAAMLLEYECRRRGVRKDVQVDLYTPEPGPMAVAGAAVSAALRQMVEAKGIGYHPGHTVTSVDPATRRLTFVNGAEAAFDLLAYVPPHRAPTVVRNAGMCGDSGWIPVDQSTLETTFPGVYAIGDVTGIVLASIGKPLPKAGVFAHNQAQVVAHNIVRAITGKGEPRRFSGDGECFVEIGDGRAAFGSGNFYADPAPAIRLKEPSRLLHLGKVIYEKAWLYRRF